MPNSFDLQDTGVYTTYSQQEPRPHSWYGTSLHAIIDDYIRDFTDDMVQAVRDGRDFEDDDYLVEFLGDRTLRVADHNDDMFVMRLGDTPRQALLMMVRAIAFSTNAGEDADETLRLISAIMASKDMRRAVTHSSAQSR